MISISFWLILDCSYIAYTFIDAGLAHLVERHLAKVEVASSSLVTRSKKLKNGFGEKLLPPPVLNRRYGVPAKAEPCVGCDCEFEPRNPLQYGAIAKW